MSHQIWPLSPVKESAYDWIVGWMVFIPCSVRNRIPVFQPIDQAPKCQGRHEDIFWQDWERVYQQHSVSLKNLCCCGHENGILLLKCRTFKDQGDTYS
jgi:hypothetical protein